jgi:hypothetical protein
MKMETKRSPDNSVGFFQAIWRDKSENRTIRCHRYANLKSNTIAHYILTIQLVRHFFESG